MSRARRSRGGVIFFVAATLWSAAAQAQHPRLWVRQSDLTALRARATESNPVYVSGLRLLAEEAKSHMDEGLVPALDMGGTTWDQYPSESYAMLFAFMSLIENDASARNDYAARARTLLMHVIDEASKGVESGEPFRDPAFATSDRSRWWGEGFGLTVDWIYPHLNAQDKAKIRTVFLRWAEENNTATTTNHNHPVPIGIVNSPQLLANETAVPWAANNYYLAHMRNIGLMAMSFDESDDPDGSLVGYVRISTGAWLYVWDHVLRTWARGGFSPEGFEYGPDSLGFGMQFLYALYTAGITDPAQWGSQVEWWRNPFWNDVMPAYLHSLSPGKIVYPDYSWIGEVYQPAWFGDGQNYWVVDAISIFGPLGLYWGSNGNDQGLQDVRWLQTHVPPGGAEMFLDRVSDSGFRDAILYFLLFDPAAALPSDPRSRMGYAWEAEGIGRILARTDWSEDASFFSWFLSWNRIDHQLAEGNQFELYRKGEWLTKGRVGWDGISSLCSIGRSDYHNTLAVENERGELELDDWPYPCQQNGSQMIQVSSGDPAVLARSLASDFVYATGVSTPLYNSEEFAMNDVTHVSRSLVWLMPDHVIVYDRAETRVANRFKRFWINTPSLPEVSGSRATARTPGGQTLHVHSLLPVGAVLSGEVSEDLPDVANEEPMHHRLRVEAPGGPASTRFLHVLHGVDGNASSEQPVRIESSAGTPYSGAVVRSVATLFRNSLDGGFSGTTYMVPSSTVRHLITGLEPGALYSVTATSSGGVTTVSVQPGGAVRADGGGVIDWRNAEGPRRRRGVRR